MFSFRIVCYLWGLIVVILCLCIVLRLCGVFGGWFAGLSFACGVYWCLILWGLHSKGGGFCVSAVSVLAGLLA